MGGGLGGRNEEEVEMVAKAKAIAKAKAALRDPYKAVTPTEHTGSI